MKRSLMLAILLVLAGLFSVVAVEWEELESSATVVTDHKTGLPALLFSTGLAYNERPDAMRLHIVWEVFRVDDGSETMLYEFSRTATAASLSTYFSSQPVLIEPGGWYKARVQIDDYDNALSYTRTFSHLEPYSLPVGLRFVGWDGTEEADLAAMTDKDLSQLVRLQRAVTTYEVIAEGVSVSTFFSQHAATDAKYPVSVILLPETGVENNWGSQSKPITVTFGLTVQTFFIPNLDAGSEFQHQLSQYEQTFQGTVYAGPGGDAPSEGVVIFVDDAMRVILNEAVAELAARND